MKFMFLALLLAIANADTLATKSQQARGQTGDCMPQVLYFKVWDADSQAPTGEVIDGDNMEVCFPSTRANIEAISTDCTRRVLLELTRPDGSTFNRNEGREPYLVFGDKLSEDPPKVNGRFFEDNGAYSISAYPKSDPTSVLTYDFTVKLCETPTDPPTKSPVSKPPSPGIGDCTPTQGTCASTQEELQAFLDASNPYEIVAICDGATIDTSTAPITITQDHLTMCCTGSHCILENNGSGRNLIVNGAAASIVGIEFVGGVAAKDSFFGLGGNVFWSSRDEGDNNIIDCVFRDGTASFYGGNLHAEFPSEATIKIEKSTFVGGKSGDWGGGAFITDANEISIRDCDFTANTAGFGQDASLGGGLVISSEFGQMPKLEILNSSFNDNERGAIAILAEYDFTFSGNSGSGNTPHVEFRSGSTNCTDLYDTFDVYDPLDLYDTTPKCIPLDAELP